MADSTKPLKPDEEPVPGAPVADTEPAPPETWTAQGPQRVPFLASVQLLVPLVLLCVLLAGTTAFAWYGSNDPEEDQAPSGVITSSEARDAGMQAASSLTQKVLSYDWKTLDADMRASERLLAPSFRTEYTKALDAVKDQTIKNQVKLSANVVATSIVSATDRKVEALVFVNQVTTAKGSGNQRLDQNRVLVTLTCHGGEWRVSRMDAF